MFLCRGVDRTGPFQCLKINKRVFVAQVPFDPVELEMNEKTQGLVSPEPFLLPIVSPLWTPVAYAAFDESNAAGKVRKGGGTDVLRSRSILSGAERKLRKDDCLHPTIVC